MVNSFFKIDKNFKVFQKRYYITWDIFIATAHFIFLKKEVESGLKYILKNYNKFEPRETLTLVSNTTDSEVIHMINDNDIIILYASLKFIQLIQFNLEINLPILNTSSEFIALEDCINPIYLTEYDINQLEPRITCSIKENYCMWCGLINAPQLWYTSIEPGTYFKAPGCIKCISTPTINS